MMVRVKELFVACLTAVPSILPATGEIVIRNNQFELALGGDATVRSLTLAETGEDLLDGSERISFCTVTQERPFVNEVKLAHPNKRTDYRATALRREGDRLIVGFEHGQYEACITVREAPSYVAFALEGFLVPTNSPYRRLQMDAPPVEAFRIVQMPVRRRKNFGDWLGVMWDEKAAVSVVGTSPEGLIDHVTRPNGELMTAELFRKVQLEGAGAALIAAPRDGFLPALERLETDYGLPPGVALRRSPALKSSIARVFDLTPKTVDEHIRWAKKGGFRYMQVFYSSVTKEKFWWPSYWRCGDYDYRDEYPNGKPDLVAMLAKLKAAGITPGLHILPQHIGMESRYVTPVADRRLNLKDRFTLARPLPAGPCGEIAVDERIAVAPLADKCRVLRFGGELMTYEGVTATRPYAFTGVTRGAFGTTVVAHPLGEIGGILDMSEFGGVSCYVDQETDLQDEIADKIANIYSAGFEFVYFDGAEGVSAPFNYHVGNAQYRVWKKLSPVPLFAEGAAKAHFSWHMLSGANAFDAFKPELFKAMIAAHPAAEAPLMARNFTKVNFGWWQLFLPSETSVGTQPDMWEYGASRAAAWDCQETVCIPLVDTIAKHPRADDLFEVLRRWEDVRANGLLTAVEKESLKDLRQEHHLYLNADGKYELHPIEMLPTPERAPNIRAFLFERKGKRVIAYWHMRGASSLEIDLGAGVRTVPADKIRYLETDLDGMTAREAYARSRER